MTSVYAWFSIGLLVRNVVSIFPNKDLRDSELARIVTDQCQCVLYRKHQSIIKHDMEKNSAENSTRSRNHSNYDDTSASGADCPAEFHYHFENGTPSVFGTYWPSCYKFIVNETFSWEDAVNVCAGQGALLISIETEDEQKHVKRIINEEIVPKPNESFWTSGFNKGSSDEWSWRGTGDPIEFTAWSSGNPNKDQQQCLSLWHKQDWAWDDHYCHVHLYALCEKEAKTVA